MPTRSLLYHASGLRTMQCIRCDFEGGATVWHMHRPRQYRKCAVCRSSDVVRRGAVKRRLRLVPIGLRPTFASVRVQRLECRGCGALRQEYLPFADPFKRYTHAFGRFVVFLSQRMTVKDVAEMLHVSWGLVRSIQERYLRREAKRLPLRHLKRLAIDELAVGKGHDQVTVVMDLSSGRVVHVGDGKGSQAILGFFRRLKRLGAQLEAVATDMANAYVTAVKRIFPDVCMVLDRFHVMQLMNQKLSDLRRRLYNNGRCLRRKDILRGTPWLLLKNPAKLDPERNEAKRLAEALGINRPLAAGYYLEEDLRQLWEHADREQAAAFLDDWAARARASGLHVLQEMANCLQRRRDALLNYCCHRISTGPLAGFNNKARTMKRQAYGYRNREFYKLKLLTLHTKKCALVG